MTKKVSTVKSTQTTFQQYFQDYPSIAKGLNKLHLTEPTDLQQSLLEAYLPNDNFILTAPAKSGKTIALILCTLKMFFNEEEGVLLLLSHSKDLSQMLVHLVSALVRIPLLNLFMQEFINNEPKQIVVCSPLQANSLTKSFKDRVCQVAIVEADYLFWFGYGEGLKLLASSLPSKVSYKLSCIYRNTYIEYFKTTFLKRCTRLDYLPPADTSMKYYPVQEGTATHFYEVGDKLWLPISLYVTLKFHLVNPKILILCGNLREVYRTQLLLDRCRISGCTVYNHYNPVDLKFYTISLWITGNVRMLIATKEIIADINGTIFKENLQKSYHRNHFDLNHLATIICLNLVYLERDWSNLFSLFPAKPFLLTFIENKYEEIDALHDLLKYYTGSFATVSSKTLPITRKYLYGFRYRINDVYMSLGNHKVDLAQQLDFNKKILKSPDLKEHFQYHPKEREVLIKTINELRKKVDHYAVIVTELVPAYLVPECLKATYEEKLKLIQKTVESYAPYYHKKVSRLLKYVTYYYYAPYVTDVSRLKLISARKRWKLQHGFKLKKRNLRNYRKEDEDNELYDWNLTWIDTTIDYTAYAEPIDVDYDKNYLADVDWEQVRRKEDEEDRIELIHWAKLLTDYKPSSRYFDSDFILWGRRRARERKRRLSISDIESSSEDENVQRELYKERRFGRKRQSSKNQVLSLQYLKKLYRMFLARKYTAPQIANYFKISYRQVYQHLETFKASGGHFVKAYLYRRKSNNPRDREYLAEKNARMADAIMYLIRYTPKMYQFYIKHALYYKYQIIASQASISRCMYKQRLVKKKPTRIFIETNTDANIKKRYEFCQLYLNYLDPMKCIFLDECGINNRIKRERGWVMKGQPFHCYQPADGANKYSLLAAISFERMLYSWTKFGTCNAKDMVRFINEKLGDKYNDYVLILDNAKIHKTPEVKYALARNNMRSIYLPPYTPQLNPIELVFHELKSVIRNMRAKFPYYTLKQAIYYSMVEMYKRTFMNYERRIRKWAEKGINKERFESLG